MTALSVYEWMKAPGSVGGAGLSPTVYTYTAAMRAALAAGLLDRALAVWEDAQAAECPLDCRLCITYIEVRRDTGRWVQCVRGSDKHNLSICGGSGTGAVASAREHVANCACMCIDMPPPYCSLRRCCGVVCRWWVLCGHGRPAALLCYRLRVSCTAPDAPLCMVLLLLCRCARARA
jgi:pentatricopeptide repeat protein